MTVEDKASKPNCVTTQKQLDTKQLDQKPVQTVNTQHSKTSADACIRKKKKLKSPSTRKRDRLRLEKWLSKKRSDSNNGCKSSTAHPSSTGSTGCVIDSALDVPAVSSSFVSHVENTQLLPVNNSSSSGNSDVGGNCDSLAETQKTSSSSPLCESDSQLSSKLEARPETPSQCKSQIADSELEDELDPRCFNLDCSIRQSELGCKLLRCSRCATALYCSKTCQSKHWRLHRPSCRK